MEDVTTQLNEMGKAVSAFREYTERELAEVKKIGAVMPETKDAVDRLNARLDRIEEKLQRPAASGSKAGNEQTPEQKAFVQYLRRGAEHMPAEEAKALEVSTDTAGGYTVVPQVQNSIVEYLIEYSPIRTVANVVSLSSNQLEWPVETAVFAGGWTVESGTRSESTGETFGKAIIPCHEGYVYPKVTRQLLEDSSFDIEGFIARKAGLAFAKLEGTAFVSGTGVGQPEGMLTHASVSYTAQGEASTLTNADGLIALVHAVQEAYARNGRFLLSWATLGLIRKLKGGDGQYIWQPNYQAGNPGSVLGFPYTVAVDMPSVTTNTYPVIFGDLREGYCIANRNQMSMLRDPYSSKTTGVVEFMFFQRVGGKVVNPAAIRKLKIAAA